MEDATGRLKVSPDRAEIETIKVVDRMDPAQPADLGAVLGQILGGAGRTVGYHTTESLLPIDRQVYVLGEVSDSASGLTMGAPSEKGKVFLISPRTEEELIGSARSATRGLQIGSIACGAIGAVLLVVGFVVR